MTAFELTLAEYQTLMSTEDDMRRAAKVDTNQAEIVTILRQVGATVTPIHMIGQGVPDLLVGYRQANFLLEVKDGSKPPSAQKLTRDEQEWHDEWRGSVVVVRSADEALKAVGAL